MKSAGGPSKNLPVSHLLENEGVPVLDGDLIATRLDTVPFSPTAKTVKLNKNTSSKLAKSRSTRTCGGTSSQILINTPCSKSSNGGESASSTGLLNLQSCATANSAPTTSKK